MGYGSVEGQINDIVVTARRLASLCRGKSFPDWLDQRLGYGLQHLSEELLAFQHVAERFDPKVFRAVAKRIAPYELQLLLALPQGGPNYGIVSAHAVIERTRRSGVVTIYPTHAVAESISVDVYLGGENASRNRKLLRAVDNLVEAIGYHKPTAFEEERGSLFRRARAKAAEAISSDELRELLNMVELAAQNYVYEDRQADINLKLAQAFEAVMRGLQDQPRACIRIGSLLIVKDETAGKPVTLTKILSPIEIRVFEKLPGIQKDPSTVLANLALMVAQDEGSANDDT